VVNPRCRARHCFVSGNVRVHSQAGWRGLPSLGRCPWGCTAGADGDGVTPRPPRTPCGAQRAARSAGGQRPSSEPIASFRHMPTDVAAPRQPAVVSDRGGPQSGTGSFFPCGVAGPGGPATSDCSRALIRPWPQAGTVGRSEDPWVWSGARREGRRHLLASRAGDEQTIRGRASMTCPRRSTRPSVKRIRVVQG